MMNKENMNVAGAMAGWAGRAWAKDLDFCPKEGVFRVAETKSSRKQAASLKKQAGPAHRQASMPRAENILQEEKGLRNTHFHPYWIKARVCCCFEGMTIHIS